MANALQACFAAMETIYLDGVASASGSDETRQAKFDRTIANYSCSPQFNFLCFSDYALADSIWGMRVGKILALFTIAK